MRFVRCEVWGSGTIRNTCQDLTQYHSYILDEVMCVNVLISCIECIHERLIAAIVDLANN